MDDAHSACRIRDFSRWPRIVLEHEREHLSRAMRGRAFMTQADADGILHDITDIDYLLAQLPVEVEVHAPEA